MIEWIGTLTFFNWLSLAAFVLALVGFLNSVLNLRSRYKDWRGTKSKQAFEKRLQELELQLFLISKYRKSPTTFFTEVLYEGINLFISLIGTLILFVGVLLASFVPLNILLLPVVLILMSQLSLMSTLSKATKLKRLINYVRNAELLAVEVFEFVNNGRKKGFIAKDDNTLLDSVLKNDMFTENELEFIKIYVDKFSK